MCLYIYVTHRYNLKVSKGYKINIVQLPGLWIFFNICHSLYCFSVHSITPYSLFANTKCCKKSSFMFHFCTNNKISERDINKTIPFTITLKRIYYQGGQGLHCWLGGKESTCNSGGAGDFGLISGLGSIPGGGHGNPLQYSCLENPMDRGARKHCLCSCKVLDTTEMT